MTVTDLHKDPENLMMTIRTQLAATPDRAWQLWADPRQLERWWGPPSHPATVVDHELVPGGRVSYYMTSPEGEKYHGWWTVIAVDPPSRLELEDGFADDDGNPNDDLPTSRMVVTLTGGADGTVMVLESRFPSLEAMEQQLAMGLEEGIISALGQIDAILDAA